MPYRRPLVVSAPSGSGKSTLLKRLFDELPGVFGFCVSHTTRAPRPGEENGKQYHFVSREEFGRLVEQNKFIENAEFSGNRYGTSYDAVNKVTQEGQICLLEIELQGIKIIKQRAAAPGCVIQMPYFLFIKPPSIEVLEQRLRARGTESDSTIASRLAAAKIELDYAEQPGSHDFIVVNDDIETAYKKMRDWIVSTFQIPNASKK